MTTIPRRIVIDLELTTDEDAGLLDGILHDLGNVISENDQPDDGVLDSWDARIEDPREEFEVVAAGNAVDGFRFFGPVPADLDGSGVHEDGHFDDDDWVIAKVQPYPNRNWEPLA